MRFNRDNHGSKPDDTQSMKHYFSLDIHPQPKERAREGRGHWYTPRRTVTFESAVRNTARSIGLKPRLGACVVEVTLNFKKPKSMKPDEFRYHTVRPDGDNVYKAITDAMKGIAYKDDCQIVQFLVSKNYSEKESIEVTIEYLD